MKALTENECQLLEMLADDSPSRCCGQRGAGPAPPESLVGLNQMLEGGEPLGEQQSLPFLENSRTWAPSLWGLPPEPVELTSCSQSGPVGGPLTRQALAMGRNAERLIKVHMGKCI